MRKIICMGILVLMTVFCAFPAQAAGGAENTGKQSVITPRFTYISLLNAGLSINSSGKATSLVHIKTMTIKTNISVAGWTAE